MTNQFHPTAPAPHVVPPAHPHAPPHHTADTPPAPHVVVPHPHADHEVNIIDPMFVYPHPPVHPVAQIAPHGIVGTRLVTPVIPHPANAVLVLSIFPPDGHPVRNIVLSAALSVHGVAHIADTCHATHAIAMKLVRLDSIALVAVIIVLATHAVEFDHEYPCPHPVGAAAPDTNTRLVAVVLFGRSEIYESSPAAPLANAAPPAPHLPT